MSKSDAKNEIDNLLNEIQELQQTLDTPAAPKAEAGAETGAEEDLPKIVEADDQFLEEFTASAELPEESLPESDMEATLAALRPEEPVGGALAEMTTPEEKEAAPVSPVRAVRPVDSEISKMVSETLTEHSPAFARVMPAVAAPSSAASPAASAPLGLSEEEGALSLNLRGRISLELIYESFEQKVRVSFGEAFLTVSLQDGTEFKIPVAKKGSGRVKAVA